MKGTIFSFTTRLYTYAGHALHAQVSERKCHTRAYNTHAPHLSTTQN